MTKVKAIVLFELAIEALERAYPNENHTQLWEALIALSKPDDYQEDE